jgi:hypothetical protein
MSVHKASIWGEVLQKLPYRAVKKSKFKIGEGIVLYIFPVLENRSMVDPIHLLCPEILQILP